MIGSDVGQVSQYHRKQERMVKNQADERHYHGVFPSVEEHVNPIFFAIHVTLVVIVEVVHVHQDPYAQCYTSGGGRAGYGPRAAGHGAGNHRVTYRTHVMK